ncbi:hypothetical protein RQP46_007116 [Phenoliferia psychrophenolica]
MLPEAPASAEASFIVPTKDVIPALSPNLSPTSEAMLKRCGAMQRMEEEEGKILDYIVFGADNKVCCVGPRPGEVSPRSLAFQEFRVLAEEKRNPRAVYMLYMLLVSHCGEETVTTDELNEQLRDEYGVDVHKAISLGGAPAANADYTFVEEKLSSAMRKGGVLASTPA